MMASSPLLPNSPGPPSFRETAAACVGLADRVMGLFQFDSVEGVADDGEGLGVVLGADDVVSSAGVAEGSGAMVGTGAGAGAAGAGGGARAGVSITGGTVCAGGSAVLPGSSGLGVSSAASDGHTTGTHGSVVPPSSARAGAAERPTESARTTAAPAADTSRSTVEDRIMVTFSTARGTPTATNQCFR